MELTREQVRELDRRAIEDFGIPGIILMENAGRAAAEQLLALQPKCVAIFCGKGNNGGDGYVIARHLFNNAITPHVLVFARLDEISGDAAVNLAIIRKMQLCISEITSPGQLAAAQQAALDADVIVDALLGTGISGEVRGLIRSGIEIINRAGRYVLAVDIPSGLDANSGDVLGVCVRADATVTFVAHKTGFARGRGPEFTGRVAVAEISIPRQLLHPHQ